ncbi:MAG: hypothetical protein ACE5F1_16360 [Planctomycetota bacterium]
MRVQWIWSDVDTLTYDPGGANLAFNNDRNGGYARLAYRPAKVENEILKDLEAVLRYDKLNLPAGAPTAVDEQRVTFGLNYWLSSSAVAKIAYQLDEKDDPSGAAQDENAFFIQLAMGF